MGLDMYLSGKKFLWTDWKNPENNRQEDGFRVSEIELSIGYWRKHPNLHGYIVKTFAGGEDNCQSIDLTADALRDVIKAVQERRLPETSGFFFGKSDSSAEEIAEDVKQLTSAITWLEAEEKGVSRSIEYRASW